MAMASWGQILNAAMGMPALNNSLVRGIGQVFTHGAVRATAAAAASALYSVKNYLTTGAAIEGLLPAAIAGIPLGPVNLPLTVFLTCGTLEIAKQVVDAVSTFRQNRSQAAAQQILADRQATLLEDVDGEIARLNGNLLKQEYQSLAAELARLQAAHNLLRQNNAAANQRTDAQLIQDRAHFEQLKQVQTKILSIKDRINVATPSAFRNELQRLIMVANNPLGAGNDIQATLEALEALDQQLELMSKVSEKALTLTSIEEINTQKDSMTLIQLKQNTIIPQIQVLEAEIAQLQLEIMAINSGADKGGLFTTKAGRLNDKQFKINSKVYVINQLRMDLVNSAGLSLHELDKELARLGQLPPTAVVAARIQGYQAIREKRHRLDIAVAGNQLEEAVRLRAAIQTSPFLESQAIELEIGHLNGDLTRLPSLTPQELAQRRDSLNAITQALNNPVNAIALGNQQQAFQQVVAQIPAPAQPAPAAAAAAAAAPAQPAPQPQGAPQLLPPVAAAAAAGPVDFSIENPANAQGPRILLSTFSPFPAFQVPGLPAGSDLVVYDIAAPSDADSVKRGSMCLAPVLSAALKVPHLVAQLPNRIQDLLNDGAERALFGDSGPGGIGIQTQRDNPQCPRDVLVALLNVALCFRKPGADPLTALTENLRIIEMNLSKMKGLTEENKAKITEMVILLNLLQALRQEGGNISEDAFKRILGPFFRRYGRELPSASSGPAAVSQKMAERLEALVMGPASDMAVVNDIDDFSSPKKHALVCLDMPVGSNKKIPETFGVKVNGKKVKYQVVSVIETSGNQRLEATTHTRSEKVWSSYSPLRAQRVMPDAAIQADGYVTFQVGNFNQATLFAVPAK